MEEKVSDLTNECKDAILRTAVQGKCCQHSFSDLLVHILDVNETKSQVFTPRPWKTQLKDWVGRGVTTKTRVCFLSLPKSYLLFYNS